MNTNEPKSAEGQGIEIPEDIYTFALLQRDVRRDFRDGGGNSLKGAVTTMLWRTSFHLLLSHRISRWFRCVGLGVLCGLIRWLQFALAGSEISPRAKLGHGIRFPHPTGIVIGRGALVEDGAWIFQQVTIGSHGRPGLKWDYPTIGEGAKIYAGARVLGGIRIGKGATIGANAVVLQDVPDGATAVGIPARIIGPREADSKTDFSQGQPC